MFSDNYSGKKLFEIPEEDIPKVFVKNFIIAFDKVNRREKYGTGALDYYKEIDIVTKKDNRNYVVLANIKNIDRTSSGCAQVYFNEEVLLHYHIDVPKLTRTIEICRIVERALYQMKAHMVYKSYYERNQLLIKEDERNLIENARELLIAELFTYTESLQKEYEKKINESNEKKRWWKLS